MRKITFLALLFSFVVNAQEVIDQQQTNYSTYFSLAFDDVGQGFTAGQTKKITKLEVLMDCGSTLGCTGQPFVMNFYNANANFTPNGSALVANMSGTSFHGGNLVPIWSVFTIASGPTLSAGNKYVFVISGTPGTSDYGVMQATNNPYAGGNAIYKGAGTSNAWTGLAGQDIAFKVWVENALGQDELLYKKDFFLGQTEELLILKSLSNEHFFVYDLTGKKVTDFAVQADVEFKLELNKFSKGVYVLSNGSASAKFVVR